MQALGLKHNNKFVQRNSQRVKRGRLTGAAGHGVSLGTIGVVAWSMRTVSPIYYDQATVYNWQEKTT